MKSNLMRAGLVFVGLAVFVILSGCSDDSSGPSDRLMTLNPASLQFTAWAGLNPNPAQKKVLVKSQGAVDTVWTATATGTWLRLGPTGTDTIFVSVISNSLPAGTYHDTVFVASPDADNVPLALPVTLQVNNRLVTSVDSLVFNSLAGGLPPDSQMFEVADYIGAGATFSAVSNAEWIELSGAAGTAPGTVIVYIDQVGLAAGRFSDSVVITSDDLPGARTILPVYLNLSSWSPQNLASPSVNLEDVQMVDANHAWCSGYLGSSAGEPHGLVFRTVDGGANWSKVEDDVDARYGGLAAPDDTTCWVVGDSALLTHTVNGGAIWVEQANMPIPRTINLRDIIFVGHQYGWAIGRGGAVIHSSDSGGSWTTQNSGVSFDLNDIQFLDEQTGWIAGNHGTVLATVNGGQSWNTVSTGDVLDIYAIDFVDTDHGWASATGGKILRTSNGGSSWQIHQTGTSEVLTDIHFADLNRGWAVGLSGVIFFTDNGGLTWLLQPSGTAQALTGVHFLDDKIGLVVGIGGTVLRTANGGY